MYLLSFLIQNTGGRGHFHKSCQLPRIPYCSQKRYRWGHRHRHYCMWHRLLHTCNMQYRHRCLLILRPHAPFGSYRILTYPHEARSLPTVAEVSDIASDSTADAPTTHIERANTSTMIIEIALFIMILLV